MSDRELNKKILVAVICVAVIVACVVLYIFRDVDWIKYNPTLVQIKPYFDNGIQSIKESATAQIGIAGTAVTAAIGLIKTKLGNSALQRANNTIDDLEKRANQTINSLTQKTDAEKTQLAEQIKQLTTKKDEVESSLLATINQLKESTETITKTQTLLSSANERIENLTKDNETLHKAIEFMKANEGAYIQ